MLVLRSDWHEKSMVDIQAAFERWKEMAELQLDFIERLGEYKLNVAKAELVDAVALNQLAVARMKAALAKELERTLRRLSTARRRDRRRIQRLARQAADAALIREADTISLNGLSRMWSAYSVLLRLTPAEVIEELTATPIDSAARKGRSYLNRRRPAEPCDDVPEELEDVLGLLAWIRRRRYAARPGTRAYRQVIAAFGSIAQVAERTIGQIEAALRAMEQETFEAWKPLAIAALPDTVDVQKIVQAGVKL